tara:strand:- start:378 stop:650 length:273 start_codon:yes stop_codon:yes gene_type:complete
MPKYVYYCKKCEGEFEVRHSLQETIQICQLCESSNEIERRPSAIFLSKKNTNFGTKNKAGTVMKETIEESRQDLRLEQEKLSNRRFDDVK